MNETAQATGSNWLDVLRTGVQGVIDSQIAKNYALSDPRYNTAGGVGGQAQYTSAAQAAVSSALPLVILGAVALLAVVLVKKL